MRHLRANVHQHSLDLIMKTSCVFISLLLVTSSTVAQLRTLVDFENSIKKKIEVGMSTDEVKKVLGRPKAIEGGFPDESTSIIADMPEQKGQINNSTWFYFYNIMSVKVDEAPVITYLLNGKPVSEQIFDDYVGKDTVYYHDGSIIFTASAQSYRDLNDTRLQGYPIDRKQTFISKPLPRRVTKVFLPIFCVIFDRGTQVVAATRMFFKIQTP
jgi:hypothetical protein